MEFCGAMKQILTMPTPIDPFTIRPLSRDDAPTMADIHQQCFPDPWGATAFFSYFDNSEWEGVFGFAAIQQHAEASNIVGFILGRTCHDTNDILTFAVYDAFQKKGIGHRLLSTYLDHMPHTCLLEVATSNVGAIALYTAFGFEIVVTRRNYYPQNAPDRRDAYVMRRTASQISPASPTC
jgi:ribosomal-protein-alanine N-acetyltransferase